MRKQSGFTLIELMVVMAIIAILATAGLTAYGGYLKKARDSTRISDLKAIESVVIASLGSTGGAPTLVQLKDGIKAMNNDVLLEDPLEGKAICWDDIAPVASCVYWYHRCTNGTGYIIGISFEDGNKISMYTNDPLGDTLVNDTALYEVGENCDAKDVTVGVSGIIES